MWWLLQVQCRRHDSLKTRLLTRTSLRFKILLGRWQIFKWQQINLPKIRNINPRKYNTMEEGKKDTGCVLRSQRKIKPYREIQEANCLLHFLSSSWLVVWERKIKSTVTHWKQVTPAASRKKYTRGTGNVRHEHNS